MHEHFPGDIHFSFCSWIVEPTPCRRHLLDQLKCRYSTDDIERFETYFFRLRAKLANVQCPLDDPISIDDAKALLFRLYLHVCQQDLSMPLLPAPLRPLSEAVHVLLPPVRVTHHVSMSHTVVFDGRGSPMEQQRNGTVVFRGRVTSGTRGGASYAPLQHSSYAPVSSTSGPSGSSALRLTLIPRRAG